MVMMFMVNYALNQDGQDKQEVFGEIKKDLIIHNFKQLQINNLLEMVCRETMMDIYGLLEELMIL